MEALLETFLPKDIIINILLPYFSSFGDAYKVSDLAFLPKYLYVDLLTFGTADRVFDFKFQMYNNRITTIKRVGVKTLVRTQEGSFIYEDTLPAEISGKKILLECNYKYKVHTVIISGKFNDRSFTDLKIPVNFIRYQSFAKTVKH